MTVVDTLRHSRFVFAFAVFVGVAMGMGLSVLLGSHDESFDDCVAREMRSHAQHELLGIRRVCAKRHGTSLVE
jgi:hypothetical protein